jgi:basic membrane lipoprotein Med (substrate-binding protein (PBP1-ABC) superfamily)
MTKSNTIGTVAAMDIPEVARLTNAFCFGAKEAEPAGQVQGHLHRLVLRPAQGQGGGARPDRGWCRCGLCERFGVIEAAQEKGILAISNMSDQSALAPRR